VKKILSIAVLFVVMLSSCDEEFEIAAPYKSVSLVYGLLDQGDAAHYIRIQKAFLDGNKNALLMAQNPDSSELKNITVTMKEFSGTNLISSTVLTKVDLIAEGFPKDSGAFFNAPHFAYKYTHPLNSNYTYRLSILHDDNGKVDSAETPVIDQNFSVAQFNFASYQVDFSRTTNNATMDVNGIWPDAAKYLEAVLTLHYVDKALPSGVQTDKSLNIRIPAVVKTGPSFVAKLTKREIYMALANNLPKAEADLERYMDSATLTVYMGGEELYNYNNVEAVQGSGITADQIQVKYTNIKGENVLGLLNTRAKRERINIPVSNSTLDSLTTNALTADLNFVGRSDH